MTIPRCDPTLLVDYLEDRLSPQKETAVEEHLSNCDDCRNRISASAGSGDDWTNITGALRADEFDGLTPEDSPQPLWPLKLLGPTDDPRMLGRIGPFEVSGCVGVGGMGVVFKARDPALDRYVAVKVLAPHLAASDTARARFAREAKAAAAVVHDNVIALHQVSEYQGLPYLVMPYLPGPSLEHRLQQKGKLAPVEALRIARQVAAGLAAAHEQGLIHRDIKPANIMLSGDTERAVITDFGLARAADDATLTQSGTLAGTPQYMAPEQARGDHTDTQSDLFSLGSVLFAMLTGEPPVPLLSGSETIRRVSQDVPPPIEDCLANVPKELREAVGRLHGFDPKNRVANAIEAGTLLKAAMANASTEPLKPLIPQQKKTVRRISPNATLLMSAAIAVAAMLFLPELIHSLTQNDHSDSHAGGPVAERELRSELDGTTHDTAQTSAISNTDPGINISQVRVGDFFPPPGQNRPERETGQLGQSRAVQKNDSPMKTKGVPSQSKVRVPVIPDHATEELDSLLNDIELRLEQLENR